MCKSEELEQTEMKEGQFENQCVAFYRAVYSVYVVVGEEVWETGRKTRRVPRMNGRYSWWVETPDLLFSECALDPLLRIRRRKRPEEEHGRHFGAATAASGE